MGVRHFQKLSRRFAQAIRARRLEMGLTQEALAEAARVSIRHYQLIEAGKSNPTLRSMLGIADALNLRLSDIFSE
jgi:transcriptional regulator with XRE-family HTH domain